jgi:hypothetical protein
MPEELTLRKIQVGECASEVIFVQMVISREAYVALDWSWSKRLVDYCSFRNVD